MGFMLASVSINAQSKADDILGTWLTSEGRAKVFVYKSGNKYFGKIIWLKDPNKNGKPRLDVKNQNAALRNKPIIDLVILKDFEFDDGEWVNGKVYEPSGGKEYSSKITMPNAHTLKVRGYIGISLFGKTDVWKRS
jgi:uncharacterized protein (DUF2147 family)